MEHNGVWNIYMCVYIYMYLCMYICMYKTGMSEIDSHLIYNKDNKGKYLGKSGLFTMWFQVSWVSTGGKVTLESLLKS